jgi:hypothetical protein
MEPKDKALFEEQLEINPNLREAHNLACKGWSNTAIAEHFGVHYNTVRSWFKSASFAPRPRGGANNTHKEALKKIHKIEGEEAEDDSIYNILEPLTEAAVKDFKRQASAEEDESLAEIAAAQSTAADKYQHYIAAAGIKLLRDSLKTIKGPRTVKELSDLDQLIRRNMGLNEKGAGRSNGKMQIDISILNNSMADKGKGSLKAMKSEALDADVVPEKTPKTKKK